MGTKCKWKNGHQVFSENSQFISVGAIESNQQIVSDSVETVLVSETIPANMFNSTSMHFRITICGELSSDGSSAGGDLSLTLRYGTTDILALTTVSLANEDDKQFKYICDGRIHTIGSSGKIVASAKMDVAQGTPLYFFAYTAAAGVTANLTVAGSINVTADWEASSADNDIIAMIGYIEYFN